jgi:hypothetical protein
MMPVMRLLVIAFALASYWFLTWGLTWWLGR